MSAKYRADVDGLRALAIIPVVLYHAGTPFFGGGFVGVDVFFVISGFLITGLIAGEMAQGRFSISTFYERRIRRIFPALFTVVSACVLAGWAIMSPADYDRLGKTVAGTATFLSNVVFWHLTGYFGAPAAQMPLLHTWSLAVEEQYYVLFPLLMLALTRWLPRQRTLVIALLCVISFAVSAVSVYQYPAGTFYLAPTRAWELALGALLALRTVPTNLSPIARNALALSGVALILGTVVLYDTSIPFPGLSALPPALGAMLIILAGMDSLAPVSRFVASRPLVFVGKISYSLYLWHFPLLAFAAYLSVEALGGLERAALVVASVLLACVSWKFVEQPARRQDGPQARRKVLALGVLATVTFWGVGHAIDASKGVPSRMSRQQLEALRGSTDHNTDRTRCFVNGENRRRAEGRCAFYAKDDAQAQFVLWGDSHGEAMRAALRSQAERFQVPGTFMGDSGCPPVIDTERTGKPGCAESGKLILQWIIDHPSVRTVMLAGRWGYWTMGTGFKMEQTERISLSPVKGSGAHPVGTAEALTQGLLATVGALVAAGREVWIVGPTPEVGYDVPLSRYRQAMGIDRGLNIDPLRIDYLARESEAFSAFALVKMRYRQVRFVWPHHVLCDERRCRTQEGGMALYYDDDHLSTHGAQFIAPIFAPVFESMRATSATSAVPQLGASKPLQLDTRSGIPKR